jgi:hypothetical protein
LKLVNEIVDKNGNEILGIIPITSAVNEITIKNNSTGNAPEIQVTGDDSNIDLNLITKGTGIVKVNGDAVVLISELTENIDAGMFGDTNNELAIDGGTF